jgi:hypothetical protein
MPAQRRATHQREIPFRKQLESLEVVQQFDRLVGWGCDPDVLKYNLRLIRSAKNANTWEKLIGVERHELGAVQQRLLDCAEDLERLGKSYYGLVHLAELCWRDPEVSRFWPDLPGLLREFAVNLKLDQRQLRLQPRSRLASNYAIALLVRYVIQATKHPRDPEVAALIAAFEWRPDFTADALKVWRHDHDTQLTVDKLFVLDFLLSSR